MRHRLTDHPEVLKAVTASKLRMAASQSTRREIPEDFKYNPKKIRHLKNILHNVSVSLENLTSSFNEFSRFKGPEISPDGRLGGVGYIIPIKDIKQALQTSIFALSDVADCIADELTNPRWNVGEDKEIKKLIKEKEDAVENVEKVEDGVSQDDIVNTQKSEDAPTIEPEKEPENKPEPESNPTLESEKPAEKSEQVPKPTEPTDISKTASGKKDIFAVAVQNSLINFFANSL